MKLEADYDKATRESQSKHDITIRWDIALNKNALARFVFTKDDQPELRLIPGARLPRLAMLASLAISCRTDRPGAVGAHSTSPLLLISCTQHAFNARRACILALATGMQWHGSDNDHWTEIVRMRVDDTGDELLVKHTCAGKDNRAWQGAGIVIKLVDATEEVALELKGAQVRPSCDTLT